MRLLQVTPVYIHRAFHIFIKDDFNQDAKNPAAERNMIAKILKPLNRAYRYNITTRHAKKAADSVIGSPTGINQFAPGVMRSNMRSIIRIVADSPVTVSRLPDFKQYKGQE